MSRPSLGPRRSIHVRLPEDIYAELILLRPELQAPDGSSKYGAINNYFIGLVRRDLDERTRSIQRQLGDLPHASA